jgi:putative peptidoglycan lipid II flippase
MVLVWAVFIAGILQLGFQLPFLARLNLLPKPRFKKDAGVKRVYKLMIPALFGVSVSQINLLVDTLMASFLISGSVSWLYYSDRLMEFPIGIFGIALATVMLPDLSKSVARGDMSKYNNTLDWALRWVFLIGVPSMLGLILLASPMLTTLFYSGQFTENDVIMTARSLMTYSVGLLGFVLIKVLASGFFARQDTRTPVKIAVIAMTVNMVLNLALIVPLAHAGLALATSIAALLNAALLYRGLRKQEVYTPQAGWLALFIRISLAAVAMIAILWWGSGSLSSWINMTILERVLQLFILIIAGMLVYIVTLFAVGFRLRHVKLI